MPRELAARSVNLERRIEKLSEERIDLFARASANVNLTVVERTRLKTIERELDECYLVIRQYRARAGRGAVRRRGAERPLPADARTARLTARAVASVGDARQVIANGS